MENGKDEGSVEEPTQRTTPSTPAELASIQRDDEAKLLYGVDLSTKSRAVALFAEELQLTIPELIGLCYVLLISSENGLYSAAEEEAKRASRADLEAIAAWSCFRGGLMSLRMTLRTMLDTPIDPGLWTPPMGSKGVGNSANQDPELA